MVIMKAANMLQVAILLVAGFFFFVSFMHNDDSNDVRVYGHDVHDHHHADADNGIRAGHGVDISIPIHHGNLPAGTEPERRWKHFMDGCAKQYSKKECEKNDAGRLTMNLNQPKYQHNYTENGYAKMTLPSDLRRDIMTFWNENKDREVLETWPRGNTFVNHWESPSYMVSLENNRLRGDGLRLKQKIWDTVQPIIEAWVGSKVRPTSLYGIRVYKKGAILASHVDRLPLVSSCIIQVDQDPKMISGEVEAWPVEVYDHDGVGHNITMKPGDLVLYESHSVIHGRPTALPGTFYANIFVHFEPMDGEDRGDSQKYLDKKYRENVKNRQSGHEHDQQHFEHDQTPLHTAAAEGNIEVVERLVELKPEYLNHKDANNWTPIHEATRGGHTAVVEHLVEKGADVNAKTKTGGTPRWWAKRFHGDEHDVYQYYVDVDALEEL